MTAYAYNNWYPLAWSRDIGRALSARRVLEEDIVLYRTESGQVVALEDACPHRLAPLSIGMLQRDGLFVALGYALVSATLVWFSVLAIGLLMAGQNISTLFG